MGIRLDILDDRLEAIGGEDDGERLRRHLGMWRDGLVDPLGDDGVVLVATLDDGGPRPRRVVANDGLGGEGAGAGPAGRRARARALAPA